MCINSDRTCSIFFVHIISLGSGTEANDYRVNDSLKSGS